MLCMTGKGNKYNMKKFTIMLSVLLAIVITVLVSAYFVFNELEDQMENNLKDVANQNALALHNRIHSNHLLLESLSEEMRGVTQETVNDVLSTFEIFIDEYGLKRFAYVFPDGVTYSTDGEVTDLSFRDFFKRGMMGRSSITGVLNDAINEDHDLVNVMTVPVHDIFGNVEGVFGLTYDSHNFNEALQIECFEENGYSCVFNEEGQITVAMGSDVLQLSENLYTDVLGVDERNNSAIEAIKGYVNYKTSGGGTLYHEGENYYYCTPVSLMDGDVTWYILTLVPTKVLKDRVLPIQNGLIIMTVIVIAFILIGIFLIITLSNDSRTMMYRFAYEDPITKGPNYAKFCVEMKKKYGKPGFMVAMDVTNFSNINIAAGKVASTNMICDIWKILTNELQSDETAGHVREDAFIVFLMAESKDVLVKRLEHISELISSCAKKLQVSGIHSRCGICYTQGNEEPEDVYSKVQIAREYARTQKEKYYVFYGEMDHERLRQNRYLEERFDDAVLNCEFEVWYQPKYSVVSGEVVGSEALVRWRDKDGSLISPGMFIPLFEQNGMIARLDEYVFRMVCKQQVQWLESGRKVKPVSINLSRASLYYADIVERYSRIIEEEGINPCYIQLEVTESAMEGRADIHSVLAQFRNMGIQILMDDFGTGYSSLATLNMRCFDTLKLDKSLIDHIGEKDGETLLYYVISMGQQLGLHITAEGVENSMQLEFLKENNCDDIQGFIFAKPMPSNQFEEMI